MLPSVKPQDSFPLATIEGDKLYQEEACANLPAGTARYLDKGFLNVVVHYQNSSRSIPTVRTFLSKKTMIDYEVAKRLEGRAQAKLPDSERYDGWKLPTWQKIKRFFGYNIDLEIQTHKPNLLKPCYTAKNVSDFTVKIMPANPERFGLKKKETYRLWTHSKWAYNGSLNGYEYRDEASGDMVKIQSAVTSSSDRSSDQICMMRRYEDNDTKASISYTGRPDTKSKAIEQIEFIFRNEIECPIQQGLAQNDDGSYTLTYLVNNLMSPVTGIGLVTFDEKKAILKEQEILEELSKKPLTINGKTVHVKPLYFCQPLNQTTLLQKVMSDAHSGKGVAKEISQKGDEALLALAKEKLKEMAPSDKRKELLEGAIYFLELDKKIDHLLPEERLFNRAVIAEALNLPIVNHCKSSTDRTIIAVAVAAIAHQWNKLNLDYIRDKEGRIIPHSILTDERAKELFAGHILAGHQVTRVSRSCKEIEEAYKAKPVGYDWANNPIPARLLPSRYTKPSGISTLKKIGTIALIALGYIANLILSLPIFIIGSIIQRKLFNPYFILPTGLPFAEKKLDISSPCVGRGEKLEKGGAKKEAGKETRSLIKPKGMVKV